MYCIVDPLVYESFFGPDPEMFPVPAVIINAP